MPEKGGKLSQTTLLLRLLCGGYLVYLGGSLLLDGAAGPLFLSAAVLFVLAGAALFGFTLRTLLRGRKRREDSDSEAE